MKKTKAIIVDDELSARENLNYLIENFCPDITVVNTCCNVNEAVVSIKKLKPDVVFLDIEMPQKNGFQLIKEFDEINFQIVFITAYDQYAIKAFEVSALDYLLKPIDIDRLLEVTTKLKNQLGLLGFQKRLKTLSSNQKKLSKISIPYKSDYVIINVDDILYIEADRMYSHIYTHQGKKYTASKKLSHYEELFFENCNFKRIHRSWLANLDKVTSYSKSDKNLIINNKEIPVGKTYKEQTEAYLNN
ncbi:two-component system LytT family response regulator [Wenyingzhuangia heitensis]|uniref:Two-component system LytT family response regulator n=1 Tax=Wenyingzhuangia heitensis TaxID=1487859 RepID=A0ABX0U988_9FLAO|nr:LytTR family DNA-binding domain-containing protein [Wenyingzhuangia heitensis]NIJ44778.1 two-component system LytT family response regulator [Wenyingzhuangia heitensis]